MNKFDSITKTNVYEVTKEKFEKGCDLYYSAWKCPNNDWKDYGHDIGNRRGLNLPESFTETMGAYAIGAKLITGKSGDGRRGKNDEIIVEFKSTIKNKDLSSFSPTEKFDELWFLMLNTKTDKIFVYNTQTNRDQLNKIRITTGKNKKNGKVQKPKTVEEQSAENRRPRFSIISKIINEKKLKPNYIIDIKKKRVTKT
jgi:hypothetical protein